MPDWPILGLPEAQQQGMLPVQAVSSDELRLPHYDVQVSLTSERNSMAE